MTPEQLCKSGSEHSHQRALFAWANVAERHGWRIADQNEAYTQLNYAAHFAQHPLPQLHWLHAIHNQGGSSIVAGARAKAEGVKAGVADIFLPFPMSQYHGLYIEMKKPKVGRIAEVQYEFRSYCKANGYAHAYCDTWIKARDCILAYLGLIA